MLAEIILFPVVPEARMFSSLLQIHGKRSSSKNSFMTEFFFLIYI
jgi:hypothetical protein